MRQICVFFVRSAITDRASTKKRQDDVITGTESISIKMRQIGVFFVRSAITDRASTKKRQDGAF